MIMSFLPKGDWIIVKALLLVVVTIRCGVMFKINFVVSLV
jgi:hypothetical protein